MACTRNSRAMLIAVVVACCATATLGQLPNMIVPGADTLGIWSNVQRQLQGPIPDCNSVARHWVRAFFHDCGTHNRRDRSGGCDGSLQFETGRSENRWAVSTIQFYNQIRMSFRRSIRPSMADVITLGGHMGVAICGGPVVMFAPGRRDTTSRNLRNLLPSPGDGPRALLASMRRMGFNEFESVCLIGLGHTMSNLSGPLDSTPEKVDTAFFKELLANGTQLTLASDEGLKDPLFLGSMERLTDEATFRKCIPEVMLKLGSLGQTRTTVVVRGDSNTDVSDLEVIKEDEEVEKAAKRQRASDWMVVALQTDVLEDDREQAAVTKSGGQSSVPESADAIMAAALDKLDEQRESLEGGSLTTSGGEGGSQVVVERAQGMSNATAGIMGGAIVAGVAALVAVAVFVYQRRRKGSVTPSKTLVRDFSLSEDRSMPFEASRQTHHV